MVSTVGLDPATAQRVESLKAELQMIEARKSDPTRLLNEGELEFYAEREAELAREITALVSPQAPAAPVTPENRVTCSAEMLLKASSLYLMIVGASKLTVFQAAEENAYPIAHFKDKLTTYYAIK
jgi:6-phosphogluconolactonase/glucosamine-6-phosphate isomerase/deaminase